MGARSSAACSPAAGCLGCSSRKVGIFVVVVVVIFIFDESQET